jgi:hypothetical protein
LDAEDEIEAAAMEQARAMVRELKRLAEATPDGHVLARVEKATVELGRRFVRDRLQDVLNAQARDLEKRGGRGWDCPCGGRRKNHGRATRRLVTAAGDVTLSRVYFTCRACGRHAHALDDRLGLDGFVSPHAQRLFCTLGADWSFERCARHLREVAGLAVCDNTVRQACDRHGGLMRAWQREDPEAARPFREATGDVEFQTDGTCVNTTGGWREVRLSIFAKRRRGEPVTDLDDWDEQRLPAPHARVATAAIRTSEALGPQWRRAAGRLGIKRTDEVTALADGARWIWTEVERNLPGAAGVLDIYHAGEHLHAAAVALHGAGPAAEAWYEGRRRTLLESGAPGLLEALTPGTGAVAELVGYLEPHRGHTRYRQRLAEGRSIGSGLVEGAGKTAIGRRLKQTGARWRVRRLERMAALCCLHYGDQLEAYWKKAAG